VLVTRKQLFFGVVAVLVLGTGVMFTSVVLGGERGSTRSGVAASGHHAHRASLPSARESSRGDFRYLEDSSVVQPGKVDGFYYRCPKKAPHAVSGYFGPEGTLEAGQIVLADSFPSGKGHRNWDVGVRNLSNQPQRYFVGVVCSH
jgi:hypothetical protein